MGQIENDDYSVACNPFLIQETCKIFLKTDDVAYISIQAKLHPLILNVVETDMLIVS